MPLIIHLVQVLLVICEKSVKCKNYYISPAFWLSQWRTFSSSSIPLFHSVWGLLKVFLPKACVQRSLCRWSIAQSFKATAIGSVTRGELDKYEKECDVWCVTVTYGVWLWLWSWLDFLTWLDVLLSSRLSRTSLDLNLDLGWTSCYCYR